MLLEKAQARLMKSTINQELQEFCNSNQLDLHSPLMLFGILASIGVLSEALDRLDWGEPECARIKELYIDCVISILKA